MAEAKRLAQELSVDVRPPIRGSTDRMPRLFVRSLLAGPPVPGPEARRRDAIR